jgi:flagellar protein FliO/FliZ
MTIEDYLKFLFALILVLSLMGVLAYVLKRFGLGGERLMPADKRRIRIVEALPLDMRRKAILLRRDDVEHLVIIGASGETVVETNIAVKPEGPKQNV